MKYELPMLSKKSAQHLTLFFSQTVKTKPAMGVVAARPGQCFLYFILILIFDIKQPFCVCSSVLMFTRAHLNQLID